MEATDALPATASRLARRVRPASSWSGHGILDDSFYPLNARIRHASIETSCANEGDQINGFTLLIPPWQQS